MIVAEEAGCAGGAWCDSAGPAGTTGIRHLLTKSYSQTIAGKVETPTQDDVAESYCCIDGRYETFAEIQELLDARAASIATR